MNASDLTHEQLTRILRQVDQATEELHLALKKSDWDACKAALKRHAQPSRLPYNTALHGLIKEGNQEMTALFLANGMATETVNKANGQTPLMVAVCERQLWAIPLLIQAGADINGKDLKYSPAFQAGLQANAEPIFQALMASPAFSFEAHSKLKMALLFDNQFSENLLFFVKNGFDADAKEEGRSLLDNHVISNQIVEDAEDEVGANPIAYFKTLLNLGIVPTQETLFLACEQKSSHPYLPLLIAFPLDWHSEFSYVDPSRRKATSAMGILKEKFPDVADQWEAYFLSRDLATSLDADLPSNELSRPKPRL